MNTIINEFPDLPAVVTNIEMYVYEAGKAKTRKERNELLAEANRLATAYNEHAKAGGNDAVQFKKFV